jgi:hypothetical protein
MKYIADKLKLNLYSNKKNLHLFTEKKINPLMFKYVNLWNIYYSLKPFSFKKFLRDKDFQFITEKLNIENKIN